MKRRNFILAAARAGLCGLIAAGAARAQTSEPPQPLTPPSEVPAAVAPPAPAGAKPAPETTATAVVGETHTPLAPQPKKVKKKTAASSVAVTVMNSRATKLVALEAGLAGSDKLKKIAGPIAPGKTVAARAPRGKDCLIDLKGTFDDGETMDAAGVDVFAQKVLNLTE